MSAWSTSTLPFAAQVRSSLETHVELFTSCCSFAASPCPGPPVLAALGGEAPLVTSPTSLARGKVTLPQVVTSGSTGGEVTSGCTGLEAGCVQLVLVAAAAGGEVTSGLE